MVDVNHQLKSAQQINTALEESIFVHMPYIYICLLESKDYFLRLRLDLYPFCKMQKYVK